MFPKVLKLQVSNYDYICFYPWIAFFTFAAWILIWSNYILRSLDPCLYRTIRAGYFNYMWNNSENFPIKAFSEVFIKMRLKFLFIFSLLMLDIFQANMSISLHIFFLQMDYTSLSPLIDWANWVITKLCFSYHYLIFKVLEFSMCTSLFGLH